MTGVSAVQRGQQFCGSARNIEQTAFVALKYGGADLLIDLRKVKQIGQEGAGTSVVLADGTKYTGRLSDEYAWNCQTIWGSAVFPHSTIRTAQITGERISRGIDEDASKAIDAMFSKAAFPGTIQTQTGGIFPIEAFALEYVTDGRRCFAASDGIPLQMGDSFTELEPS